MSGLTAEQIGRLVMAGGCAPSPCDECRSDAEVYFPVVAALIAESVEQARAEERERIALEIVGDAEDDWGGADFACGCPDPNSDNVPAALLETCRRTREAAARIARGEVSP